MKKVKIEVGIPALNEEANIQSLLKSVALQKSDILEIETIFLISDGSTDRTIEKAKALKIHNLKVIDSNERLGKSRRMGQLFELAKTDYMVLLDADVILENDKVIHFLVEPLVTSDISLTSGRPTKVNTGTLGDKVMDVSLFLQDFIKEKYHLGVNVYACHGRIVGLRRDLFSLLELPYSTVGNDAYLYFFNRKNAKGFKYCPEASVIFKMPQSFSDFQKQKGRFANAKSEQVSIFGMQAYKEYKLPKFLKLKALLSAFFKFHIYVLTYFIWNIWPSRGNSNSSAKWEISNSTKSLES